MQKCIMITVLLNSGWRIISKNGIMIGSRKEPIFMKKIYQQIQDYLEYCAGVRGMSPVTLRTKAYVLNDFVSEVGLRDFKKINNRIFDKWIMAKVNSGIMPSSVNMYGSVVLAAIKYHAQFGMRLNFNYGLVTRQKGKRGERKFYTVNEIKAAIGYADAETALQIRIMFETGMRIAELAELRLKNFDGQRICFIGKGRKFREVYLKKETEEEIRDFVFKSGTNDYLWGGGTINGEPPTVNTIRNRMKRCFRAAGLEGFYPHALRHSFATNLQLNGASVAEIKEMIGHSNIATTERYLHGFDGRLEELFLKYN